MADNFNRELLLIARRLRGITQEKLAKKANISQTLLSRLENGTREATSDAVSALSKALDFPVEYFYQRESIWGLPLSVHPIHRKKKRATKSSIERLQSEISLRLIHINKLLEAVDLEPDYELPRLDPEDYEYDFEYIANSIRRNWHLPPGPITDLTYRIELAGVFIIHANFQASDIDGLSIDIPGLPPCIFLNKDQPADRMRFSLAHELGHLVMHRMPTQDMEKEANAFASALLMPKNEFKRDLVGKISLKLLAQLKPIWRVSIAALLFRAQQVKAITKWQAQNLWKQMNVYGYRRREPIEIEMETPSLFPEIIKRHLEELEYSPGEFGTLLRLNKRDMFQFYGIGAAPRRSSHLVAVPR